MGAPVGVPVGACGLPLCPLGSLIIPQILMAVKWCFPLLTSLGYLWYTEEFISVFSSYPQVIHRVVHKTPQGSLGLIWVNMGFDLDQLFAFG